MSNQDYYNQQQGYGYSNPGQQGYSNPGQQGYNQQSPYPQGQGQGPPPNAPQQVRCTLHVARRIRNGICNGRCATRRMRGMRTRSCETLLTLLWRSRAATRIPPTRSTSKDLRRATRTAPHRPAATPRRSRRSTRRSTRSSTRRSTRSSTLHSTSSSTRPIPIPRRSRTRDRRSITTSSSSSTSSSSTSSKAKATARPDSMLRASQAPDKATAALAARSSPRPLAPCWATRLLAATAVAAAAASAC
ncbi:hypothetical protein B0T26DRAFT_259335 [Lasiosphaeria miniovina]|uniref:Uncharacterized protein n=1 Tax=Lasiosphaeria miniovina TaxID=1954250 RepID=A0AA40E447_9PEZI|nr:uncharacterized protein B0T26DRAFT_259335 [Lasiosphaeria miniovina]KAK0723351.1 hypothetical protein B0T26DRAFT_259335 [Lasiosphaeria miniovina]